MTPEAIGAFADSLLPSDEVAIEAKCNTHAIVKLIAPPVARVVISNPMKTRRSPRRRSRPTRECGLDMTVFPTVGHFASWAGACPGHHQSASRPKSGRTRPGPGWLTAQLTECTPRCRTNQRHLSRLALRPAPRPAR
jgi:hypothetical protein